MNRWITALGFLAAWQFPAAAPPPLAKGVSSHGAAACDGYVLRLRRPLRRTPHLRFHHRTRHLPATQARRRHRLGSPSPAAPGLQGLALVAHKGSLVRVGGMTPKNAPGEDAILISTAECSRYDVAAKAWAKLPEMPAPRSSDDAWVIGDNLYVIGGWAMNGKEKSIWHDTALMLDLAAKAPEWKSIPQPFQRRALACAGLDGKLYAIGGLDAEGKTQQKVEIYDTATGKVGERAGPSRQRLRLLPRRHGDGRQAHRQHESTAVCLSSPKTAKPGNRSAKRSRPAWSTASCRIAGTCCSLAEPAAAATSPRSK